MSQLASDLLNQVLTLSQSERCDVAAKIMDSLDPTSDADVEAAWADEIRQRIEDVRSGKAATMTWQEAREFILSDDDSED
jgi:putative addiction module component (TIGR02574 family)